MWKIVGLAVLSSSLAAAPVTTAHAQLISVKEVRSSGQSLSSQVLSQLESKEARQKIEAMGLSYDEARSRLAGMSEQELRQLLENQGVQQAGGDLVISLTTVLLIVIIVLLVR